MSSRSGQRAAAVAWLLVVILGSACAAPAGRGVGSQPPSVVLSLANGNHGHEALLPIADAIARASGGTVSIAFEDEVHSGDPRYESALIDDVAAGTYDLGWVAPRPWHDKGVTSFDALMAPFLVDSYPLQQAVLESDLQVEMLAGLEGTGLVGLGILPGPLRRIAMAEGAVDDPDDLRGRTVAIGDSAIARMTFEALGASVTGLPSGGVLNGVDGVEQQLQAIIGNRYHLDLPDVTADLAFWPRPVILIANQGRFERLTADQQAALRGVAGSLIGSTTAAVETEDAAALGELCADGASIVTAGSDGLAALRQAVEPVYEELRRDAATATMLTRIATLKSNILPAVSEIACPSQPAPPPSTGEGLPDGAYEARLSCAELEAYWAAHPDLAVEDRFPCPMVMAFTLKDGVWEENYGARWTYSFFGDHLELGAFTLRWSWDGSQVTFSEIEGGDPGDGQAWTTKPFTRVGDATTPSVGFADGTYRAEVTAAEMEAFWSSHDVPIALREPCPCRHEFDLRGGIWTGGDGSTWEASFFGDRLTVADRSSSFTLRWRSDPQIEEVTFLDVDAGGGDQETALAMYFLVKPFDRQEP